MATTLLRLSIVTRILRKAFQSDEPVSSRVFTDNLDPKEKELWNQHVFALSDREMIKIIWEEMPGGPNIWIEGLSNLATDLAKLLENDEVAQGVDKHFSGFIDSDRFQDLKEVASKIAERLKTYEISKEVKPKRVRLSQAARKLNVSRNTIISVLLENGFQVDNDPKVQLTQVQYQILVDKFKPLSKGKGKEIEGKKDVVDQQILEILTGQQLNEVREQVFWSSSAYVKNHGDIFVLDYKRKDKSLWLTVDTKAENDDFISKVISSDFFNIRVDSGQSVQGFKDVSLFSSDKIPLRKTLERYKKDAQRNLENNIDVFFNIENSLVRKIKEAYELWENLGAGHTGLEITDQISELSNQSELSDLDEQNASLEFNDDGKRGENEDGRDDLSKSVRDLDGVKKNSSEDGSGVKSNDLTPTELINNPLQLATLNSDSAHQGQDLLGFKQDIEAFASIVALKELTPPLAIALFGQWGTGKSFFMQKLSEKVQELADTQGFLREKEPGAEEKGAKENTRPFCEGVCQIHFNAWSYMDTNLWASLVTRIFEGLDDYINDNASDAEDEKAKVKGEISKQLDVAKGQLDELVAKKEQFEDARKTLTQQVEDAQKALNDKVEEIKKSSKKAFIESALDEFKVQEKLEKALANSDVKLPEGGNLDPDLILKELKSAHAFVRQFLSIKGKDWYWILPFVLLIVLVFLPIDWSGTQVGEWVNDQWAWLTKTGTAVVAFITGALAKVKQALNKLSPMVNKVIEAKDAYDSAVQEGVANHQQDVLAKQIEADQKEVELNQLVVQLKAKEAEIKALEFSSESGLAHKAMYNFITRKAKSSDYTKHLGIISMIRKDFETLSELFVESSAADLSKLKEKERKKLDAYHSIRKDFKKPLERIVLYVDDLDRCPEDRVVEVLEAVNLLMAFPLFVVIVGVDPRWVKNALIKKYQLQFTGQVDGNTLAGGLDMEVINPSDYLEKIFQVPFHLMSPSDDSIKDMIEHLVGDAVLEEEEVVQPLEEPAGLEAPAEETVEEEEAGGEAEEKGLERSVTLDDSDTLITPPDDAIDDFSGSASPDEALPSESVPDMAKAAKSILDEEFEAVTNDATNSTEPALVRVTPESLKLHPAELQYMKDFAWLIGNTPRTVKRFVNMYRIIRAHEGLSYQDDKDKVDLLAVMFILALRIGAFSHVFDEVLSIIASDLKTPVGELIETEFEHQRLRVEKEIERQSIEDKTEKSVFRSSQLEKFYKSETGSVLTKISNGEEFEALRSSKGNVFESKIDFVKRFSFKIR